MKHFSESSPEMKSLKNKSKGPKTKDMLDEFDENDEFAQFMKNKEK